MKEIDLQKDEVPAVHQSADGRSYIDPAKAKAILWKIQQNTPSTVNPPTEKPKEEAKPKTEKKGKKSSPAKPKKKEKTKPKKEEKKKKVIKVFNRFELTEKQSKLFDEITELRSKLNKSALGLDMDLEAVIKRNPSEAKLDTALTEWRNNLKEDYKEFKKKMEMRKPKTEEKPKPKKEEKKPSKSAKPEPFNDKTLKAYLSGEGQYFEDIQAHFNYNNKLILKSKLKKIGATILPNGLVKLKK